VDVLIHVFNIQLGIYASLRGGVSITLSYVFRSWRETPVSIKNRNCLPFLCPIYFWKWSRVQQYCWTHDSFWRCESSNQDSVEVCYRWYAVTWSHVGPLLVALYGDNFGWSARTDLGDGCFDGFAASNPSATDQRFDTRGTQTFSDECHLGCQEISRLFPRCSPPQSARADTSGGNLLQVNINSIMPSNRTFSRDPLGLPCAASQTLLRYKTNIITTQQ